MNLTCKTDISTTTLPQISLRLIIMGLTAFALVGCNQQNATSTDNTASDTSPATQGEVIKVATESSYPPFSYIDSSGKEVGFEIDLINALCADMNATCEIRSQDWDGLIPAVKTKKVDAAIAGMSITPERLETVDFTNPYFESGIILISKVGSGVTLDNLDNKAVGAQRSTVSSQYLADQHPNADIQLYDTQENAFIDMTNGRLQAMVVDQMVGINWLNSESGAGFEQVGETISSGNDDMGIAVRKGSPLKAKFDMALDNIRANGTYDRIHNKYFAKPDTQANVELGTETADATVAQ